MKKFESVPIKNYFNQISEDKCCLHSSIFGIMLFGNLKSHTRFFFNENGQAH